MDRMLLLFTDNFIQTILLNNCYSRNWDSLLHTKENLSYLYIYWSQLTIKAQGPDSI